MKLYDIPNNLKVMAFLLAAKNQEQYFISASEIEIYLSLYPSREIEAKGFRWDFASPGLIFRIVFQFTLKTCPESIKECFFPSQLLL